ncbi:RNA helicase [Subtercola boreus]|uniref:RNA helicase n=1 Tax=Subtercola boreus TaxID=120213 RepID=A0A3E0W9U1_9MICO|nr:RNA helicase [Subtercola boreus]RFA20204.1 RNA helicase [Subtercola boreus]RFA26529.1 RNA helicase [Subtercola boreus]
MVGDAFLTDTTFADLKIEPDLVQALASKGILHPFPIQTQTIPLGLEGQDIIGQAKTGTGKTFGFGLPLLQRLGANPEPGVQALVVVPTRELAVQVTEDLQLAASNRPTTVIAIYGGKSYEGQIEQLKAGAQVVVGTPGRLLDLAGQRLLSLANVKVMVLDEADKMLDLGFLADVEKLFSQTPAGRHTMLFSATMPGPVVALARRFMSRPIHIRATDPDEGLTQANIKHVVYRAHNLDKDEVIARILQAEGRGKTVIFTRTKRAAARLVEELGDRGFNAAAVHGDLNQEQRERAMAAFKAGKRDVLIATDVAARGIDVNDVTHVINHTIPEDEKTYLHRAGRTGRAGKTGIAVTFVDWDDLHKWALINRALDMGQPEPVETYSSSPHLYTDLDIPAGVKGRLKPTPAAKGPEGAASRPPREGGSGSRGPREGGREGGRDGGRGGSSRGDSSRGDSGRGDSRGAGNGRTGESRGTATAEAGNLDSSRSTGGTAGAGTTEAARDNRGSQGTGRGTRDSSRVYADSDTTTAFEGAQRPPRLPRETAEPRDGDDRPQRARNRSRNRSGASGAAAGNGQAGTQQGGNQQGGSASSSEAVASAMHGETTAVSFSGSGEAQAAGRSEGAASGSHAGHEHHDGNSAPRRRSRSRGRAPRAE